VAGEHCEEGPLYAPVIVVACIILEWVNVGVDIHGKGLVVGGGDSLYLAGDGEEVVVGIGAALHLSDGSQVVVFVYEGGVGVGAEPEKDTG
jgi:hypothetical protein